MNPGVAAVSADLIAADAEGEPVPTTLAGVTGALDVTPWSAIVVATSDRLPMSGAA